MLPLPCSKCNKKKNFNCTIPNATASLTYTIGNSESGIIGVDFFEEDTPPADEEGNGAIEQDLKSMYLVPIKAHFRKPHITEKDKLPRNKDIYNLPPIQTPDDNYSIEILKLRYDNEPNGSPGSITINAIIGCKPLKKKYKVNLKAKWDFEEMTDEETEVTE